MTFIEATAQTSRGPVSYFVAGEGAPVVFLHAAGGLRMTKALDLLTRRHRVIMPVIPGFDGAPLLDGVDSMPALGELIAEFAASTAREPAAFGGQALGAQAAVWSAVVKPDIVSALILESPNGFHPVDATPLSTDPAVMKKEMYAHPENLPPETKPREMLMANGKVQHHYGHRQLRDEALIARLGDVRCPALLLQGRLDGRNPISTVELAGRLIPRSRILVFEDCAHNVEVDQCDLFVATVEEFLAHGLDAPASPRAGVAIGG